MDAPVPIKYITPENSKKIEQSIDFKDKYTFIKNGHNLIIRLIEEYIIIIVEKSEDTKYQLKLNYEEITNKIPYFKFLNNIFDIFKNVLQLLSTNKYNIKYEDNIIKLIIKLVNIFGTEEKHELILEKIEMSDKEKIDIMKDKIKELENSINILINENNEYKNEMNIKINKLIEEKSELKEKIERLTKENNSMKNEIKLINDKISILLGKKDKDYKVNLCKTSIKKKIKINTFNGMTPKENVINKKDHLEYHEYNYDLLIYLKERKNELLIYNKKNNIIKKIIKQENFKNCQNFEVFPFKSKFVNLGKSLLLTGGIMKKQKVNKCYLISAIETKNNLLTYEINITASGDLKEKRENHNIIYLPDKNYVFVCSGYLTKSCEYTNLSKGTWEEIKPLNKNRFNASMAYINERYIYIFYGSDYEVENDKTLYLNDMEYFDLNNFEKGWTMINYINEKAYDLSLCAIGVIPVSKNEFLICGGCVENKYKTKTYKINCKDYENPIIEDVNINLNAIFIHNLFCKIGDAYFNFDFSSKLYKFDYQNMSLGVFSETQVKKNNQ